MQNVLAKFENGFASNATNEDVQILLSRPPHPDPLPQKGAREVFEGLPLNEK